MLQISSTLIFIQSIRLSLRSSTLNSNQKNIKLTNPQDSECRYLLSQWYGEFNSRISLQNSRRGSFIEKQVLNFKDLDEFITRRHNFNDIQLTPENVLHTISEKGLDINIRDASGNTLLHKAALKNDPVLVKLFLDCGMNDNGILEFPLKPEIQTLFFEHPPSFLLDCIQRQDFKSALSIAKAISPTRLSLFVEFIEEGLCLVFQTLHHQVPNETSEKLARVLLEVLLEKLDKVQDLNLIKDYVLNSRNNETELLSLLLNKFDTKSLPNQVQTEIAAQNAYENKKYNILALLVNHGIPFRPCNSNDRVILVAAQWGLTIEDSDFEQGFQVIKKHPETGNTLFHLLCINNNHQQASFILDKYRPILQTKEDFDSKNNQQESLYDLAKKHEYVGLLEIMYPDPNHNNFYNKDGFHSFAEKCEKSRLCKRYKMDLTIRDIVYGFNLDEKFDPKGNTLYQKIMKYYLALDYDESLLARDKLTKDDVEEDLSCIQVYNPSIIVTNRPDRNTILHFIARSNNECLALYFSDKKNSLAALEAKNSLGQTCLDVAKLYGHQKSKNVFKNQLEALKSQSRARQFAAAAVAAAVGV